MMPTLLDFSAGVATGAGGNTLSGGQIVDAVTSGIPMLTKANPGASCDLLWTNTPVYQDKVVDGSVVSSPVLDGEGKQVYMQMLRYDQILCILFEAAKAKITAQENALSALTTRVAALEAKAGA